ncbi:MAG TPA: hypothetical protein VHT05_03185 [Candidatus Elarobacter sp.]|nr:hypothetical protein [Candidatus Elarobacter sp.]
MLVYDDGTVAASFAPVVALFEVDCRPYARTRFPGSTRDSVRCVARDGARHWYARVKPNTEFVVEGATLHTAGFTRTFPAAILSIVELDDGGFAVLLKNVGVLTMAPDGTDRWRHDDPEAYHLTRIDHPALPDALRIVTFMVGRLIHPFDGRTLLSWPEK